MIDLRIDGGVVIPMDPARRVIEDGAVAIDAGRIVAVGPTAEIAAAHPARRVLDARDKAVLPGFIDAHAHAGHALIRTMGVAEDGAWEALCGAAYTTGSDPEFWRAEAALAALECLRGGVTCRVSLLGGGDTIMRSDRPEHAAAHFEGVLSVGVRDVMAIGPTRPPHPLIYADWDGDARRDRSVGFAEQFAVTEAVLRDWQGAHQGRTNVALLTPVLRNEHVDALGPALMAEATANTRRVRALSREAGALFTQDGHWRGSVRRLHEMGGLGPDALLSHAIDLDDEEIALVADTDTRIAHNPSAVASIMGRCPVIALQAAGATVAIGSDATAPDRSGDMFRHMQQAMHYHRTHFRDPGVLPPGRALAMVTIEAARAIGMEAEIGSLEPGKRADVITVDLAKPHMVPRNMAPYRVVCFANAADVDATIVGGAVLMEGRVAPKVDMTRILADAERAAERMIARTASQGLLTLPQGFFGVRFIDAIEERR